MLSLENNSHPSSVVLPTMSITGVRDFYFSAYLRCRLDGEEVPSARAIQEFVQAWKQLRPQRK
jgi:hypothetical protein